MVEPILIILSCVSLFTVILGIGVNYQCSQNQERHLRDIATLQRQGGMRNLMEGLSDAKGGGDWESGDEMEPGWINPQAEGTPHNSGNIPVAIW